MPNLNFAELIVKEDKGYRGITVGAIQCGCPGQAHKPEPVPNCCRTYQDIGLFTKVVGMYRRKRFWAHCHLWCTYTSAEKVYGKDTIVMLPLSR